MHLIQIPVQRRSEKVEKKREEYAAMKQQTVEKQAVIDRDLHCKGRCTTS